jgi:voltage-gated potassium channel
VRDLFRYIQDAFHSPNTLAYKYVQGLVWFLIFFSIALLVIEVPLASSAQALSVLFVVDRVVLVLFSLEIILRVATYNPPSLQVFQRHPMGQFRAHLFARLGYTLRPLVLIDIIAVLAFFPELRGLRLLRTLRLLRSNRFFRYRNPFAILLQAFEENGLLFGLAFSVLGIATLLGGMSMYLVEVQYNENIHTAADGLWWALVTITTVGFGDIAPITSVGRIIGAFLMVAGMFTLALFAGIVGSSLVRSVLTIREEQFRMSEHVNHVVVCGYDESTHLMLDALRQEMDLSQTRVVLIDVHERPRELPPEFLWVQGDPTKESELGKVRLTHAAAVIVSGERDTTPQVADARTILTTFTIRSYLKQHSKEVAQRRSPLYVVAEILDSENVNHARSAGADEVIETRRIGYSMIAHAVGYHGIATAMSRVLISGSHNIYIGLIPESQILPMSFGALLMDMKLSKRGGLVIGIRTPDGKEHINPAKSFRIISGTQLLYLAEEPLLDAPR